MADAVSAPPERIAVVTGATSGIGFEIAAGLAARGFRTVVVGRGPERSTQAAEQIARRTGSARVESLPVTDLADRREMQRVVSEILRRWPRLDVLVHNAGALYLRRELTPEGLERTFALNVLAPFALTVGLADRLRQSRPARVVFVASAAHRGQHVDLGDLEGARRYSGWTAYGRSKLEAILLAREFARQFAGSGVTVNAVHPGFVRSGFAQNNPGFTPKVVRALAGLFGRSLERGADTPLFVAADPSLDGTTGEYFVDRRVRPGSRASRDAPTAVGLWTACAARAAPA